MPEINVEDWNMFFDLMGHSSVYPPLEEFMVHVLKIRKFPTANTIFDSYGDDIALRFSWNFDFFPRLLPKDEYGEHYLTYICIKNSYKGTMPFGLDFAMTQEEVFKKLETNEELLFLQSDEDKINPALFYFHRPSQNTIIIVFDMTKEDSPVMTHINVTPIDIHDIKEFGL